MRPTVIFDFDGTVALGNGPLTAYAAAVARLAEDSEFATVATDALHAVERGDSEFRDGYHAVAAAAGQRGIDAHLLDRAYLASRDDLATPAAPVEAPAGLPEFLASLAAHADIALVTNAPDIRIREALEALGVAQHFVRVITSARKPLGIEAQVTDALERGPVLSIGDIYDFDLAPAARLGAATALVGPAAANPPADVTMSALHLPELYPAIQTWAAEAARLG
ncbi:HAD family hydrolase [Demequina flava]|uniref:HAD family hydrolase n=1 Tax=Demequina flava TaxID=1095025 RepID=UPI0007861860|nr:HAD family hydrolase [Demequina flava]